MSGERKASARPRLMSAYLHVTHRCDFACKHCFQTEETHPAQDEMTRAQIAEILDGIAALRVMFLTITGGEPFLRRDLFDIIADARARRFSVALKTAGHHVTVAKAKRLKELAIRHVDVSLYSHDPEASDAFTQRPGGWRRTVRGIRALVHEGIPVNVKAGMTSFNHQHLPELFTVVRDLGARLTIDPSVNARMNGDASSRELAVSAEDRVDAWRRLGDADETFLKTPAEHCDGTGGFLHSDYAMCGAARYTMSISAQGEVHPCVLHPTSAGNALRDSLRNIWENSPLLKDMRTITYGEMARTGCAGCGYQSSCHPCMALATSEHGENRACNTSSYETARAKMLMARSSLPEPKGGWPTPAEPPSMRGGRALLRVVG